MVIDPRKLELIPGATFNSLMKPSITDEEWATAPKDWAEALNIHKKSVEEIKAAPDEAQVWKNFVSFVNGYNKKKNQFNAPISAGQNIDRFDAIIANRLNKKHKVKEYEGKPLLFSDRISVDLKNILWSWFEGNSDLKSYSMKDIRPFFGITEEGAHDALTDCEQTAQLIIRFLKYQRSLYKTNSFKNSFGKEETT